MTGLIAQINSILRKHGKNIDTKVDFSLLKTKEEINLIKQLSNFNDIIEESERTLKPNIIANYLYTLAQDFSLFYTKCPVLKADEKLRKVRLLLSSVVRQVLSNGLGLLGIEILEKM